MTGSGHHATGLITGSIAVALCTKLYGYPMALSLAAVPFAWWGGVFPDSGELFLGIRWVRHRTITHWLPLWVGLAILVALYPVSSALLSQLIHVCVVGFILGALTHLLFDWPNPRGIPVLTPWRHHSLSLWNSGRREVLIVSCWGLVASLFWVGEIASITNWMDRGSVSGTVVDILSGGAPWKF